MHTSKDGYQTLLDYACVDPDGAAAAGISSSGIGLTDCRIGELGGRSYSAGRAHLRWTPSDRIEVSLIGDLVNDNSQTNAQTLLGVSEAVVGVFPGIENLVPSDPYVSYETFTTPEALSNTGTWTTPRVNEIDTEGLAAIVDVAINGNLSFKSITAKRQVFNQFTTATDGTPFGVETGWNNPFGDSFQQEFRVNATVANGQIDLTGGLFYFEQDNRNTARIDIGYLGFPFDFITDQTYDSESLGVYAHAVFRINDRMNVTTGLRYSDEEKFQRLFRLEPATGGQTASTAFIPFGIDPDTGFAGENLFKDDRVDWRLSFDWRFSDQVMGYATAATGFKSGGVSPRFFFPNQILPYGVEEAEATEIGFKSDLAGGRLRLNGAYFDNTYDDQQIGSFICPDLTPSSPCLADRNLVDSEISGFELELTYYPTDSMIIDASVSTIDQEFTRIDANVSPSFDPNASVPEHTPETKFNFGIQNSFSLGGGGTLTPRLDVVDVDSIRSTYQATAVIGANQSLPLERPGYTLVNARVTWRSSYEDWEISVAGTNLTDEVYYYNFFDISGVGGHASGFIAPPFEWSLSLRHNFD